MEVLGYGNGIGGRESHVLSGCGDPIVVAPK